MKSRVLKGADISKQVKTVIERRVALTDAMTEASKRLQEAEERAAEIVAEAQRKARKIISDAEAEAEAIKQREAENSKRQSQEARQQAYTAGETQAREQVAQEVGDLLNRLQAMIGEAQQCLQHAISSYEPELVRLAIRMAERIVGVQIEQDNEAVCNVINHALQRAGDREKITLRVSEEDYQAVEQHLPDFQERFPDIENVTVEVDPRVERGGCMIQTRLGMVDARLAQQFARLYESMLES